MRSAWIVGFLFFGSLAGCRAAVEPEGPVAKAYDVDRPSNVNLSELPSNSSLLMVDGDLEKYAIQLCEFEEEGGDVRKCDVYASLSAQGSLIGYVALMHRADGVSINSELSLHAGNTIGAQCNIFGKINDSNSGDLLNSSRSSRDFEGYVEYSAWESAPGSWIINSDGANGGSSSNEKSSIGRWNLESRGDKLRIMQEKWSYCSKEPNIFFDNVYNRVISLSKRQSEMASNAVSNSRLFDQSGGAKPLTSSNLDMAAVNGWRCDGASGPFRMTFTNVQDASWGKWGDVIYSPGSPFGIDGDDGFDYMKDEAAFLIGQNGETGEKGIRFDIDNERHEIVFVSEYSGDSIICKPL